MLAWGERVWDFWFHISPIPLLLPSHNPSRRRSPLLLLLPTPPQYTPRRRAGAKRHRSHFFLLRASALLVFVDLPSALLRASASSSRHLLVCLSSLFSFTFILVFQLITYFVLVVYLSSIYLDIQWSVVMMTSRRRRLQDLPSAAAMKEIGGDRSRLIGAWRRSVGCT